MENKNFKMKKFLVELFFKKLMGVNSTKCAVGETPVTLYKNIKINKGISPCLGLSHVSAHLHTAVQMESIYCRLCTVGEQRPGSASTRFKLVLSKIIHRIIFEGSL